MDQKSFHFHEKKRVVVKIGSSSLNYEETGNLNFTKLEHLVRELCNLRNRGMDVCLVSSGAIAVGRQSLGMTERPRELSTKQACAAVGQARLMMIYQKFFAEYNQVAAQILMTRNTMINLKNRRHAQDTFAELLELGAIPVVNANDSISTFEILHGDNDTLSAIVASLVDADLLILLSDINGLYTDNPNINPDAEFVPFVEYLDEELMGMGHDAVSSVGTGGMATKLIAAELATAAGADMLIANGGDMSVIHKIVNGERYGTFFQAHKDESFDLKTFLEAHFS